MASDGYSLILVMKIYIPMSILRSLAMVVRFGAMRFWSANKKMVVIRHTQKRKCDIFKFLK